MASNRKEEIAKRKKRDEFDKLELTPEGLLEPFKSYLEQPTLGSVIGKRPDEDKKKRKRSLSKGGKKQSSKQTPLAASEPCANLGFYEMDAALVDDDDNDDVSMTADQEHFDDYNFQPDPTFAALKDDCLELLNAYNNMKEVQPSKLTWRERCSRSAEKWELCRQGIIKAVLKNENCEDARLCNFCNLNAAVIRCLDCCWNVFCLECDAIKHEREPFHDREIKSDGFYKAVSSNLTLDEQGNITEKGMLPPILLCKENHCTCGGTLTVEKSSQTCAVVTVKGRYDFPKFLLSCEKCKNVTKPFELENLICCGYWPGSTLNISYLFSFDVLKLWDSLRKRLPGSSSRGFLKSLEDISISKGRVGVINPDAFDAAFDEWCYLKYELSVLEGINGFTCPSCDRNQHTAHCDGDAKLVRCKSGGSKIKDSYYKEAFVYDNSKVDLVLQKVYKNGKLKRSDVDNRCGDSVWKAADNLPKRKRNLNETGLQVAVCRHGIAQKAVNMFQGELYGYSLYLQKRLMEPENVEFMVIDVACKYWKWLSRIDPDLAAAMRPAIGVMHCKQHKPSCQVNYGTRWVDGMGLTAGEECEQFFSYFSRLGNNTKHMLPEGREETLTEHAFAWNRRKISALAETIAKRSKKVKKAINDTGFELNTEMREMDLDVQKLKRMKETVKNWAKGDIDSAAPENDFDSSEDAYLICYQLWKEHQLPPDVTVHFHEEMPDLPLSALRHPCTTRGVVWKQNYIKKFLEQNQDISSSDHLLPVCRKILSCFEGQIESSYYTNVQKHLNMKKLAATCKQRNTLRRQLSKERETLQCNIEKYNILHEFICKLEKKLASKKISVDCLENGNFPWTSKSGLQGINHKERAILEKFVFLDRANEELKILQREKSNYLRFYREVGRTLRQEISSVEDSSEQQSAWDLEDQQGNEHCTYKVEHLDCEIKAGINSVKRRGLQFAITQIVKGIQSFEDDDKETRMERAEPESCEVSDGNHAAANGQSRHDNRVDSDDDSDFYDKDNDAEEDDEIDDDPDIGANYQSSGLTYKRGVDGVCYRNIDIKRLHRSSNKFAVSDREDDGVLISYFPENISQSTLDGHNESQACCVIGLLVCHWFLSNEADICLDLESPQEIRAVIVNSIRIGNYLHDRSRDSLPPRFLSVLEGVTVLAPWYSTMIDDVIPLQPNSDQFSLFYHLRRLMKIGKRIAALVTLQEMTSVLLLSADGRVLFIDTHTHVTHGALLLRSSLFAFKSICGFLSSILGTDYNSGTLTIVSCDD